MEDKVKILKLGIRDDNYWKVINSMPCDIIMATLGMFMDLDRKVIHLNLPNGRKAVILCVEKNTLIEIYDKANLMTDNAFVEMFEEVFYANEVPTRHNFIDMLREAISGSDPVILDFIQ